MLNKETSIATFRLDTAETEQSDIAFSLINHFYRFCTAADNIGISAKSHPARKETSQPRRWNFGTCSVLCTRHFTANPRPCPLETTWISCIPTCPRPRGTGCPSGPSLTPTGPRASGSANFTGKGNVKTGHHVYSATFLE